MGTNTRTVASWHVALERWRGVRTSFWRREEKEKRCTPRYSPLGSSRNRIRSTSTAAKAEFASKPGFMWRKIRVHYYVQLRRRRRRTCAMWTADWPLDIFNYYILPNKRVDRITVLPRAIFKKLNCPRLNNCLSYDTFNFLKRGVIKLSSWTIKSFLIVA